MYRLRLDDDLLFEFSGRSARELKWVEHGHLQVSENALVACGYVQTMNPCRRVIIASSIKCVDFPDRSRAHSRKQTESMGNAGNEVLNQDQPILNLNSLGCVVFPSSFYASLKFAHSDR